MVRKWLLIGTVLLGGVLRLSWLDRLPAGFNPDETSFGYNAYSLLKTGRDEWGKPWYRLWGENLLSFGDDRYPLYAFLTVPSVAIFGLNEFATRLPNAILGTLAIIAIYGLAKVWFKDEWIPLLSALLLSISPWHISLSRGAFETNSLTLFIPLAIYFWYRKNYWKSSLMLVLNFYSYIAARVLTVFIWLFFLPRKIKPFVLFCLLILPAVIGMMFLGSRRAKDVGIYSPTDEWKAVAERQFIAQVRGMPKPVSRIFDNKIVYTGTAFINSYLSFFSPQFLFTNGAGEANYGMIPGTGLLYYWEIVPLVIFVLFKRDRRILIAILLSVVPAALSKGIGYPANRVAAMIPFIYIAIAVGAAKIPKKLIIVLMFVSLVFFAQNYIYQSSVITGEGMNFGWRDLITRMTPIANKFTEVRFSRSLSEPHIYVAFYQKIDPAVYQSYSKQWSNFVDKGYKFLDQVDGYYLGNYRFGDLKYSEPVEKDILYVGRPDNFPELKSNYIEVFYPSGKKAFIVTEKKK